MWKFLNRNPTAVTTIISSTYHSSNKLFTKITSLNIEINYTTAFTIKILRQDIKKYKHKNHTIIFGQLSQENPM